MRRKPNHERLADRVHYLEVVNAIHVDTFVKANAAAVATNPAAALSPAWSGRALADAAAELGVTELELVIEARRHALEALDRRTTEHGRVRVRELVDSLDGWLANEGAAR